MKRKMMCALLSVASATAMTLPAAAEEMESSGDELKDLITDGSVALNFRYRFEGVDQDGFDEDAEASLLRSRLTLTSGTFKGFSGQLEIDDVSAIGPDDYNSTENGKGEYPVIADPEGTDLNQLWVKYAFESGSATAGRQRIVQGSQRFVGGVAWRQNEQTYDAARLLLEPAAGLKVDLSYVDQVNRIFGPDDGAQPAEWEGDTGLLRVDYQIAEGHSLASFGYLIDVEPQSGFPSGRAEDNSTQTFGLEYSGKFELLSLVASYARQSDSGDSTLSYDTDYYFAEVSASFKPVTVKAGYEVLAADEGVGFKTPLATLHKFQGWADKFLVTPGDGIEDAYVGVSGKVGPVKLAAVYHDFQAESSSADFGSEIDFVATWPFNDTLTLQAKLASFDTDDDSRYTDTDKFWLTAQVKF